MSQLGSRLDLILECEVCQSCNARPDIDEAHVEALSHAKLTMGLVVHLTSQTLLRAHLYDRRLKLPEVFLLACSCSLSEAEGIKRVKRLPSCQHIRICVHQTAPANARTEESTFTLFLLLAEEALTLAEGLIVGFLLRLLLLCLRSRLLCRFLIVC